MTLRRRAEAPAEHADADTSREEAALTQLKTDHARRMYMNKRQTPVLALVVFLSLLHAPGGAAAPPAEDPMATVISRQGYTVSLDLRVRKRGHTRQILLQLLDGDAPPNAYATGFVVGDGLVMTAYHAVSGELGLEKRRQLGFKRDEPLVVDAYVNGCEATVLRVDADADLALLGVCGARGRAGAPAFRDAPSRDDRLLAISRPNGVKSVSRGVFSGTYTYRGRQYWAAKMEGRDGFSGSPVYNDRAEIVGVFCGYDFVQKVALISPAERARKLLEDYASAPRR